MADGLRTNDETKPTETFEVEVRDYIKIKGTSGQDGHLVRFQIKRMSSAPWFCLQEVSPQ